MTTSMDRQIVWQWQPEDEPGIEHLRLHAERDRVTADGMSVGVDRGRPSRLRYLVQCDGAYRFQTARITLLDPADRTLQTSCDRRGLWSDGAGQPLPALQGCIDIDIETTPFTNTLPVRRLALHAGQSAEILVAYITIADLSVRPERQRYTCLEVADAWSIYRFENLASGFAADVRFDADGLVVDYPGIFKRVWSG